MVVVVGNAMDCFDGVFHEFQTVRMGLDFRFWHSAAAGCEHFKGYIYPIIACGNIIVKTCQVVFKNATEVCGYCVSIIGLVAF